MGLFQDLFNGTAVIIDDHIHDDLDNNIKRISELIEEQKIPILKYDNIPDDDTIKHFLNISFILLDWQLYDDSIEDENGKIVNLNLPANFKKTESERIIDFLKKLQKICFTPIFIFSNAEPNDIIGSLTQASIYEEDKTNYIFVQSKSDLVNVENNHILLFEKIEEWLKSTPSIYALKAWIKAFSSAKRSLFWDYYQSSHKWPNILWKNFKDDNVEPGSEISSLLIKNIETRMEPFSFEEEIMKMDADLEIPRDGLIKVLEAGKYIKYNIPNDIPEASSLGDLYKKGGSYYINIRPACDCIERRVGKTDKVYLLKGDIVKKDIPFDEKFGFKEKIGECYVFPIDEGKIIRFQFKDLEVAEYSEYKANKKGRLLIPYITYITEKYSFYLQRQGLPKIPIKSIDPEKIEYSKELKENLELKALISSHEKKIEQLQVQNKSLKKKEN